jgi:hypothetical protein
MHSFSGELHRHLRNNGTCLGNVSVAGSGPSGVAVDGVATVQGTMYLPVVLSSHTQRKSEIDEKNKKLRLRQCKYQGRVV